MQRFSLLAAFLVALATIGAADAEARSPGTHGNSASRQAAPARHAGRHPAERPAPAQPCRSKATTSMFYSTERAVLPRLTGWEAARAAPPLQVTARGCAPRGSAAWT